MTADRFGCRALCASRLFHSHAEREAEVRSLEELIGQAQTDTLQRLMAMETPDPQFVAVMEDAAAHWLAVQRAPAADRVARIARSGALG